MGMKRSNKVQYMHIRRNSIKIYDNGIIVRDSAFGGITVAYKTEPSEDGSHLKLRYSLARCRLDERYVRQEGRDAALAKMVGSGLTGLGADWWTALVLPETDLYEYLLSRVMSEKQLRRNLRPELSHTNDLIVKGVPEHHGNTSSVSLPLSW
jgi:hypothetical protein